MGSWRGRGVSDAQHQRIQPAAPQRARRRRHEDVALRRDWQGFQHRAPADGGIGLSADPKPAGAANESGDLDDDLRRRLETARAGGDKRYHAKLKEQNKMFVRERLDRIMDPGWSF